MLTSPVLEGATFKVLSETSNPTQTPQASPFSLTQPTLSIPSTYHAHTYLLHLPLDAECHTPRQSLTPKTKAVNKILSIARRPSTPGAWFLAGVHQPSSTAVNTAQFLPAENVTDDFSAIRPVGVRGHFPLAVN